MTLDTSERTSGANRLLKLRIWVLAVVGGEIYPPCSVDGMSLRLLEQCAAGVPPVSLLPHGDMIWTSCARIGSSRLEMKTLLLQRRS